MFPRGPRYSGQAPRNRSKNGANNEYATKRTSTNAHPRYSLADEFAEQRLPLQADPKRSIFRIYRDTRFAKDKSPHYDKVPTASSMPYLR